MVYYTLFALYPTRWTLLMQDITLAMCGALTILMLIAFVIWLIVIVFLTALLPIYLLDTLLIEVRNITPRWRHRFAHSKSMASNRAIIIKQIEEPL